MTEIGEGIAVSGPVTLKCDDEWDDCQRRQMCAKLDSLNDTAPLTRREVSPRLKKAKKSWQAKYRRDNPPPGGNWTHECAKTNGRPIDADHVVDVQWGGHVKGPFEYLDASVNRSVGSQMAASQISTATSFKADPGCGCTG